MNTIAAQDIKRRGICAVDEALKKRHPELRTILAGVLRDLEKDPFQPHLPPLKYHRPGGKLEGIQAVSITDKQRITLTIVIAEKKIPLPDIGTHDEIYRGKQPGWTQSRHGQEKTTKWRMGYAR